jgi:hypothetical protein
MMVGGGSTVVGPLADGAGVAGLSVRQVKEGGEGAGRDGVSDMNRESMESEGPC